MKIICYWGGVFMLFFVLGLFPSCGLGESRTIALWTDRPEFAVYAEHFNASQGTYTLEVRWFESPAQQFIGNEEGPDIIAAAWLKSASTRTLFRPLDSLFAREKSPETDSPDRGLSLQAFYPRLLTLGSIEGKQYLIPVSFNLPALVFSREQGSSLSNPFTINLQEIKGKGHAYNQETRGVYTRMGFSPAWSDSFLFLTSVLYNTSFREAAPIAWDPAALERAMEAVYTWRIEANSGIQAEDDFAFKYLYDPPAKLALSGRILFTYMESSRFFTLPEERRAGLDFRWIAERNLIPLDEQTIYLGVSKKTKAWKGAGAFIRWFFSQETQRTLLEAARNNRMSETSFGIAGGFSGMRLVTEQVFPQFYPDFLGHTPPETYLSPPNILPQNWMDIKEKVILPYLRERSRVPHRDDVRSLERRIAEWYRLNRE